MNQAINYNRHTITISEQEVVDRHCDDHDDPERVEGQTEAPDLAGTTNMLPNLVQGLKTFTCIPTYLLNIWVGNTYLPTYIIVVIIIITDLVLQTSINNPDLASMVEYGLPTPGKGAVPLGGAIKGLLMAVGGTHLLTHRWGSVITLFLRCSTVGNSKNLPYKVI